MTESAAIADTTRELVEEFAILEDWGDRYSYLIDMGRALPTFPDSLKTESALVKGCQSQVWLHAEEADGVVDFTGDSDALITRGLLAMMIRVLSGHTPQEIVDADLSFLEKLGLRANLSPTRANGLTAMIDRMKREALAIQQKRP